MVLAYLMQALQDAGLPVVGLANTDGTAANATIQYDGTETAQDITDAEAIQATADADYATDIADAEAERDSVTGAQAEAAIAQIDADIATLDGSPNTTQLIAILRRALVRDKRMIQYIKRRA